MRGVKGALAPLRGRGAAPSWGVGQRPAKLRLTISLFSALSHGRVPIYLSI